MKTYVINHPTSGEAYAAEVGPSEFYDGQIRILRVAGPMSHKDRDDATDWLSEADPEDAEKDAQWLSAVLGNTLGLAESAVYGPDLEGLLRQFAK